VPKEADDHLGSALEADEFAARQTMQVGDRIGQRVCQGALDERIALLLGIEFRGIGRQVSHRIVLRVGRDEACGGAGAMGVEPVQITSSGVPIWRRTYRRARITVRLETLVRKWRA
jgi:hypothetical protein